MIPPPHGGTLVQRLAGEDERAAAVELETRLPSITLEPRGVADVGLIASGAYSPLTGFLGRDDYLRVLHEMRLASDLPWSLPITLRITDGAALRDTIALKGPDGSVLGLLEVRQGFRHSKQEEARPASGTAAATHPRSCKQ